MSNPHIGMSPSDINLRRNAVPTDPAGQFAVFYRAIYSHLLESNPGAQLEVCYDGPARFTILPLADEQAIARTVLDAQGSGYIGVHPLRVKPKVRGTGEERIGYTCLAIDIDLRYAEGEAEFGQATGHKNELVTTDGNKHPLPTREQANHFISRMIDALGGQGPTAIVRSSPTGVHVWWVLDEVIPWQPAGKDERIERFKSTVLRIADDMHIAIDKTPLTNLAALLRAPGQKRIKDGVEPFTVQLAFIDERARLNSAGLTELLDPLPESKKRVAGSKGVVAAAGYDRQKTEAAATLEQLPALPFLTALLVGDDEGGSIDAAGLGAVRWHWDLASNSATVTEKWTENGYRAYSSSTSFIDAFGLETQYTDNSVSLSVPSFFYRLVLPKNSSENAERACQLLLVHLARIEDPVPWVEQNLPTYDSEGCDAIDMWRKDVADEVIALLGNDEELQAEVNQQQIAKAQRVVRAQQAIVNEQAAEGLFAMDGTKIDMEDYEVVFGGPRHGMYKKTWVKDEDSGDLVPGKSKRLTNWVAVRTAKRVVKRPCDGIAGQDTFTVVFLGPFKGGCRRTILTGLTSKESTSVTFIRDAAADGGSVPDSKADRDVSNILSDLMLEARVTEEVYGVTGWTADGSRFVTPAGTISMTGFDRGVKAPIEADMTDDAEEGVEYVDDLGPDRIATDDEVRRVLKGMIEDYMAIAQVNGHADVWSIQSAIVANTFAVPLRMQKPYPLYICGEVGSGKSFLSAFAMACTKTGDPVEFSADFKNMTARYPGALVSQWQDTPLVFDDYKSLNGMGGARDADVKAEAFVGAVASIHERKPRGASTQTGGRRKNGVRTIYSGGIITGELALTDQAISERVLQLPRLTKAKLVLKEVKDSNGKRMMNQWVKKYAGGPAARVYARYLQHLSECMSTGGTWEAERVGLRGLSESSQAHKEDWIAKMPADIDDRVAMAVGQVMTGFEYLVRFATAMGVAFDQAMLDKVETALMRLTETVTEARGDVDWKAAWAKAFGRALETGSGFLTSVDGGEPDASIISQAGWIDDNGWSHQGRQIGTYLKEFGVVAVTVARASSAYRLADPGKPKLDDNVLRDVLGKLADEELAAKGTVTGTGEVQTNLTVGGKRRNVKGYLIPASVFGINPEN